MNDVRDALRELGVHFREAGEHKNVRAGFVGIECPHCSPHSGKFLCGIGLSYPVVSCWHCGRHKLTETLVAASERRVGEVLSLLAKVVPDANGAIWEPTKPTGTYQPPPGVGKLLPAHRRYLESRHLDADHCYEHWGIRGIGHDGGRYAWRLFLPLVCDGKPVAWQTRALGKDVEPRYLSSPPEQSSVLLKHCLAGEQHARHAVVVVEGFFQMLAVGFGAVATCGVGYTEAQVIRLSRYASRTICFDNEPEAQRRARALADALSVFSGVTQVVNLSGPQPDSSPPDEIKELRKRCLS